MNYYGTVLNCDVSPSIWVSGMSHNCNCWNILEVGVSSLLSAYFTSFSWHGRHKLVLQMIPQLVFQEKEDETIIHL